MPGRILEIVEALERDGGVRPGVGPREDQRNHELSEWETFAVSSSQRFDGVCCQIRDMIETINITNLK